MTVSWTLWVHFLSPDSRPPDCDEGKDRVLLKEVRWRRCGAWGQVQDIRCRRSGAGGQEIRCNISRLRVQSTCSPHEESSPGRVQKWRIVFWMEETWIGFDLKLMIHSLEEFCLELCLNKLHVLTAKRKEKGKQPLTANLQRQHIVMMDKGEVLSFKEVLWPWLWICCLTTIFCNMFGLNLLWIIFPMKKVWQPTKQTGQSVAMARYANMRVCDLNHVHAKSL